MSKNKDSNIRINKVYTRNGDHGKTSLIGGVKVDKDDLRIDAYGTIDELNSVLGLCISEINKIENKKIKEETIKIFTRIQNELFNLGSSLSRLDIDKESNFPSIKRVNIIKLENEIDQYNVKLPELTSFVLPGGSTINALLHLARTICRRAERISVTLMKRTKIDENILPYLNRLSDLFFVFSRWFSHKMNRTENLWDPKL
ncbi:MAG: ATP:cob(I)alamin adenosyltransferase [Candidatus Marinimicrobia bacterium]|nr:ATP:cob(I)alamin adenosyltransferase [Candidatus Neomarinimicrobiota bacterium]|tara:strand:- start:28829 stop:29431 length:603 start_codon:yes stop_codon:yes gene_type:complete